MKIIKALVKKHATLCSAIVAVTTACAAMALFLLPYRVLMPRETPSDDNDPFSPSMLSLARYAGITYELERDILAKFIFSLAEKEPYVCQVSIGATIKNRTESANYPSDTVSVIFNYGAFFNKDMLSAEPSERASNAARDALLGIDPSGGALYFFKNDDTEALSAHKNRITASFGSFSFAN